MAGRPSSRAASRSTEEGVHFYYPEYRNKKKPTIPRIGHSYHAWPLCFKLRRRLSRLHLWGTWEDVWVARASHVSGLVQTIDTWGAYRERGRLAGKAILFILLPVCTAEPTISRYATSSPEPLLPLPYGNDLFWFDLDPRRPPRGHCIGSYRRKKEHFGSQGAVMNGLGPRASFDSKCRSAKKSLETRPEREVYRLIR